LIGEQSISPLDGCASGATVAVTWSSVSPGSHIVYAVVDSADTIPESDEGDNILWERILVATQRMFLPAVLKGQP
jgi:subtilase family serine protease